MKKTKNLTIKNVSKKALSLFLVLAMILGLFTGISVYASAETINHGEIYLDEWTNLYSDSYDDEHVFIFRPEKNGQYKFSIEDELGTPHAYLLENGYEMDFPSGEMTKIPVTDDMERAFGVRPVKAMLGMDLVCVFENEDQVRCLQPDQALLTALPGRIQNVTARGKEADCVSRSFCPKLAIPEDPVCGSAHCQIAPYWAKVLGKKEIHAFQASRRGGVLTCVPKSDGRIAICGEAVLVAVSEIMADLNG